VKKYGSCAVAAGVEVVGDLAALLEAQLCHIKHGVVTCRGGGRQE